MDCKKKYKEALALARSYYDKDSMNAFLDTIFPELKESEDERIRKAIIKSIEEDSSVYEQEVSKEQMLAYLEKQKEQKLTEWKPQSEALEALKYAIEGKWEMIKPTSYLSRRLEDLYEELVSNFNVDETPIADKDIEELEAMKAETDASMEKPAEWSEEDEDMLNSCISSIEEAKENRYAYKETDGDTSYDHEIDWLKSLRPSWKPSEEQMIAFDGCLKHWSGNKSQKEILESLYEQLKKLM